LTFPRPGPPARAAGAIVGLPAESHGESGALQSGARADQLAERARKLVNPRAAARSCRRGPRRYQPHHSAGSERRGEVLAESCPAADNLSADFARRNLLGVD
jgi:hypothetical protein